VEGLSELPALELRRLQIKATLGFYLRPKILWGLLREINRPGQIKTIVRRLAGLFSS
jgi:hypothetical protein